MSFSIYFFKNFKNLKPCVPGTGCRYTYDLYTTGCRTGPAVSCRICIMYHTLYHTFFHFLILLRVYCVGNLN